MNWSWDAWEQRTEPTVDGKFITLIGTSVCLPCSVNIIDSMLESMEKYKHTLEEQVEERTIALQQEKDKTDRLLYSLMPRYIQGGSK